MPRYYFDIHANGQATSDKEGALFQSLREVRGEAMKCLPAIAHDEVGDDGDRQAFTVVVRDDGGRSVFTATLTYTGVWLVASP